MCVCAGPLKQRVCDSCVRRPECVSALVATLRSEEPLVPIVAAALLRSFTVLRCVCEPSLRSRIVTLDVCAFVRLRVYDVCVCVGDV